MVNGEDERRNVDDGNRDGYLAVAVDGRCWLFVGAIW